MRRRLGRLEVEAVEGEGAKFTAPMLLVHGLWDDPAVWRPFMGYLAHRGWQCFAVGWRSTPDGVRRDSLTALDAEIVAAVADLGTSPIVVGHDLGALLALRAAPHARAVVALSPPPVPSIDPIHASYLARTGTLLERLRGRPLSAPPLHRRIEIAGLTPAREAPALLRELRGNRTPPVAVPANVPALLVCGDADPVLSIDAARRFASQVQAQLRVVRAGSHALHHDTGWDQVVSEVHRWLIRSLGEPLLARLEEAHGEE